MEKEDEFEEKVKDYIKQLSVQRDDFGDGRAGIQAFNITLSSYREWKTKLKSQILKNYKEILIKGLAKKKFTELNTVRASHQLPPWKWEEEKKRITERVSEDIEEI